MSDLPQMTPANEFLAPGQFQICPGAFDFSNDVATRACGAGVPARRSRSTTMMNPRAKASVTKTDWLCSLSLAYSILKQ